VEPYVWLGVLQVAIAVGVVGYLARKFDRSLDSYVTEKGKNLATREDIEEITRKIESVKTDLVSKTELRRAIAIRKLDLLDQVVGAADEMTRKGLEFGTQAGADRFNELGKLVTRSEHLLSLRMVEQVRYFVGSVVAHGASLKHMASLPQPESTERAIKLVQTFTAERDRMIAGFRRELHVDDDDDPNALAEGKEGEGKP